MIGKFEVQYLALLAELVAIPNIKGDRTGVGTRGVFGRMLRCNLEEEFPLLTTKRVHLKSIITELSWFLRGRTDVQWLKERKCSIWDEWATKEQTAKHYREEGDLGPVYGFQWRHFGAAYLGPHGTDDMSVPRMGQDPVGFDQLQWLVDEIGKNPNSRRLLVTAWNPKDAQVVTLPPCHWAFQVQIADGRLNLMVQLRSCDVFLGLPFNVASYALLAHFLAKTTGYRAGDLVVVIGDTHLYTNHIDQAKEQLSREPRHAPLVIVDVDFLPCGVSVDLAVEQFSATRVLISSYDPHEKIIAPVAV